MGHRTGGGASYDINWQSDGKLFSRVTVVANVIVKEIGGSGGSAKLERLELTLSAKQANTTTPCDTNILYCGDLQMRNHLPFPIFSNAPNGRTVDGIWLTDTLIFMPADPENALLPLTPNHDGTEFYCSFPIVFNLMVMGYSFHEPVPTGTGLHTDPPNICDQTAILRGWFSDGQEIASMHSTQTRLLP